MLSVAEVVRLDPDSESKRKLRCRCLSVSDEPSSVSLTSQDSAKSTVVRSAVSVNEFATHPPIVEISVLALTRPFCREIERASEGPTDRDRDNSGGVGGRT